jgi:hypothetical protein
MTTAQKAAGTRKRRAAGRKAARTRKRRAAANNTDANASATADDVADWMLNQIEEHGQLLQVEAVATIEKLFGSQFVYVRDINEMSIDRGVLNSFRKMTQDDVVWVTRGGVLFWEGAHWRPRKKSDSQGRTQYAR